MTSKKKWGKSSSKNYAEYDNDAMNQVYGGKKPKAKVSRAKKLLQKKAAQRRAAGK